MVNTKLALTLEWYAFPDAPARRGATPGFDKNLIEKGRVRFRRGWAVQSGDPEKAGRKTHGGSAKWIAHPGAKMV